MDIHCISPTNDRNTVYQKTLSITITPPKAPKIAINFNGGQLTSDAGTLLLQLVSVNLIILVRFFVCLLCPFHEVRLQNCGGLSDYDVAD
jgi:hypothetical protein